MGHADGYTRFVNKPLGKKIAKTLGLPQPVALRRHTVGDRLVPGSILVLGTSASADIMAEQLFDEEYDVRRDPGIKQKFSAIIVAFDDLEHPTAIQERALQISTALRGLEANGRVVTVFRQTQPSEVEDFSATLSAQHSVEGMTRSLAKELRYGATANGIRLSGELQMNAPAAQSALRFLLSGRSAYVTGQFLPVGSENGVTPKHWDTPLEHKVFVVTGAARGIGASISQVLARDGATVIGVDMPSAGDALAAVINQIHGIALQLDITSPEAAETILKVASDRFGRLDGIIHNAGITRDKLLVNMDEQRWSSLMAVNLAAPLRINEQLLAARGKGLVSDQLRIVSLASTSGIAGNRGQTNYAAAKSGIIGMTEALAPQLEATGGSINAVAPGFIETAMTDAMPAATREIARRMNALQQGGQPVDVAEAIAFLSADTTAGINGTTLRVCGQSLVGK